MIYLYYKNENIYIDSDKIKIANTDLNRLEFSSNVHINLEWVNASIKLYFKINPLKEFHHSLIENYEKLTGTSNYQNDLYEDQFSLTYAFDSRKGNVTANGSLWPKSSENTKLIFEFTIDQTYIPFIIDSIYKGINKIIEQA